MSTKEGTEPGHRGRPLSPTVEQAVFDETLRLVSLVELSHVTRLAIADGSGVSRQTLYNRWPTIADIVLEALLDRASASIGSNGPGLRRYLTELAEAVNGWARPGLRLMVAAAQSDAEFAQRFRDRFMVSRHRALTMAVAYGFRGEA